MKIQLVYFACLALLATSVFAAEDATKNHRAEKRQDYSSLFFGGWRPVKGKGGFHHGSATGRYHDLISALPDSLDTSSSYYTHALPSNYFKDIYSYYPRPAIKAKPKKNTPVYMERYKPRRQQPKQAGRGAVSSGAPQFIDIQKLDLKQLNGLQDILLQAKELPLSQLNLPNKGEKQYEILEVSLQTLPQDSHNTGSRNMNRYRNRGPQRNNKGIYGRIPQNHIPAQLPLQYQYITVPKIKSLLPQILPKDISITPVKIPHAIPAVDDILGGLKNIQVVEVPVPAALPIPTGKSSRGSQYGQRANAYSQPQYRIPIPKSPQKASFPANTYYAHQTEQPRKHYSPIQSTKSSYGEQQQHQIEAELIKLSEHEIQDLLKKIQVVSKNSQDFLKFLPIAQSAHKAKSDQLHLILALPQANHGRNTKTSVYESQGHGSGEQDGGYDNQDQYIAIPKHNSYPSHGGTSISHNSGGYQIEGHNQEIEHNAEGYQVNDQAGPSYEQAGPSYEQAGPSYEQAGPSYEQAGHSYEQAGHSYEQAGPSYDQGYQNIEVEGNYEQNSAYQEGGQKNEYAAADGQEYEQVGHSSPSQHHGVQNHREQYIEVISPQSENGYRREPVLAVEIHRGQSIEEAIKAIDPETLKRLGAHGKDGLEIEVVEVPTDEYSSESKKTETYVASSNTTTKAPTQRVTSISITTSKGKSTTTEKKS